MKKIIVFVLSVLAFAAVASAQPRAIGVRATYGVELSYQHSLGSNFIEADLGWSGANGFNLAGIYDFIIGDEGAFNFYAGPGAALGLYNYSDENNNKKTGIGLGIAGQLGMEYNFNIPLTLSLDWRPVFNFIGNTGFGWQSIALGIRYRF